MIVPISVAPFVRVISSDTGGGDNGTAGGPIRNQRPVAEVILSAAAEVPRVAVTAG
jgi:hypothetical protein